MPPKNNPKEQFKKIAARLELELKRNNKKAIKTVSQSTINRMKDLISKGISPIQGRGRFPAYKGNVASRTSKTKKGYPYNVKDSFPDKKITPVNLKLSGDFLDNLDFKQQDTQTQNTSEIGFFDQTSIDKELGHRTGHNKQGKRPIIPIGSEQIAVSIQREVLKEFSASLDSTIERVDKTK